MTTLQRNIFGLLIVGCIVLAASQTSQWGSLIKKIAHNPPAPEAIKFPVQSRTLLGATLGSTDIQAPSTYPKTRIIYLPRAVNGTIRCYVNYEDIAILLVPQPDKGGSRNIWKEGNPQQMSSEYRVEPHSSYTLFGHWMEWGVGGPYDTSACTIPLKAEKP